MAQKSKIATTGFKKWTDCSAHFRDHSSTQYHMDSMIAAENYVKNYHAGDDAVTRCIRQHHSKSAESNKRIIVKLIRTVIFLAKQNIPFRGHRDSGRIEVIEGASNDGNFRSLLRYLALYYDDELKQHLLNSPGNAMYISPEIQTSIIEIAGNWALRQIVDRVNASGFFSVIADETTDSSTLEQLTIVVRYLEETGKGKFTIREDFLGFVSINDLTGAGIATAITTFLKNAGVNMSQLRGKLCVQALNTE